MCVRTLLVAWVRVNEMAGQQAAAEVCLPRGKHTVHRHLTCTKVVHDSVEELMQQLEDQGGVERGGAFVYFFLSCGYSAILT